MTDMKRYRHNSQLKAMKRNADTVGGKDIRVPLLFYNIFTGNVSLFIENENILLFYSGLHIIKMLKSILENDHIDKLLGCKFTAKSGHVPFAVKVFIA